MIGTTLSGYRITEKIRDGGASTVWKAEGSGRLVAIKVISEEWNADASKRKAFQLEGELTKRLRHPAILAVHAYTPGPPRPYIVMEFFPSENLKFVLKNRAATLDGKKLDVLRQAAEALAYLHSQGYVHRDVKPENFLVDAQGRVRLIDFSIALKAGERPAGSGKTEGTPTYMAPEQIRGEAVDGRADAYAFGVVVFEVMAGRPPFAGTSLQAVMEDHLKKPAPPLRSVAASAPPELDTLVRGLLQKKREDRTDLAMAAATLERIASGKSAAPGGVVVSAAGDVTVAILTEARMTEGEALEEVIRVMKAVLLRKAVPRIVINLQKVEYISSALLGKLVEIHKLCKEGRGALKVCGLRPAVRDLLRITQLDKVIEVFPDVAGAAGAFSAAR
ncbi:MAG: protein kinase [Planctomycetota bacterium]